MEKPTQEETAKFEELKNKIAAQLKIEADARYVFLIRKGIMKDGEAAFLRDFWRRHMGPPALFLTVENPEKDIRALEIKAQETKK